MANPQLTPEERLLRIIESPSQTPKGYGGQRKGGIDFKLQLKLLAAKYKQKFKFCWNLKSVNILLVTFAVVGSFLLLLDFWFGIPRPYVFDRLKSEGEDYEIAQVQVVVLDPLGKYLGDMVGRNIFALPDIEEPIQEPTSVQASQELVTLAESLKLVGIIWSEAPQAIIEDASGEQTYLVSRGSAIKTGRVKEILKDSVILSYHNEEIELR